MLELFQVVEGTLRKQGELAGIDLVSGNREHDVPGVDEAAQHRDEQVRFQPESIRLKKFNVPTATY